MYTKKFFFKELFLECVEACAKMISAAKYQMQTIFETVPILKTVKIV